MEKKDLFARSTLNSIWAMYRKLDNYEAYDIQGKPIVVRPKDPRLHTFVLPIYLYPKFFENIKTVLAKPDNIEVGVGASSKAHPDGTVFLSYGDDYLEKVVGISKKDIPIKFLREFKDTLVIPVFYPDSGEPPTMRSYFLNKKRG